LIDPRREPAWQFAAAMQEIRIDIGPDRALTSPHSKGRAGNEIRGPTFHGALHAARFFNCNA
jgi:hypothetical protein